MNKVLESIIRHPKSLLNGLMVVAAIILISFLFPKGGNYDFNVSSGDVWGGEDFVAPRDIFIWKKESEIEREKNQVERNFRPIFRRVLNRDAFYISVENMLTSHKDSLSTLEYEEILGFISATKDKEVLQKGDLEFNNRTHDRIRVLNQDNLIVLDTDGYLTNEDIKVELAALMRMMSEADFFDRVTIQLDKTGSRKRLEDELAEVFTYSRKVSKGDLIVAQGSIISDETAEVLQVLSSTSSGFRYDNLIIMLGFLLLTCLIIGVFIVYILFHYPSMFNSTRKMSFLLVLILVYSFFVYSIEETQNLSSYLIPFCIAPIVVKSFFSDRLALFTHIVIVLIASFLSSLGYEFTFLQILAGIVAVLVIEDTRSWNHFFLSILSIVAAYFLGYLGLSLIDYQPDQPVDWSVYRWLGISGVLTLLAYPFIPLLAKVFGFISTITMAELGDLNRPLLKELSLNAPGTLQHSLQVANLAEAAADTIGANAILLKVGALYHDIGKLHNPSMFIENQRGLNPHDHLTNFESARGIIEHVHHGIKLAQKHSLPEDIVRMIKTHHGTTRVEYFYRQQVNQFPDKEFDVTLFDYPGPKPRSKEESILMMADSLEAASKSLKNPTGKDIDDLVDKIIDYKINGGQFSESELTYEEMKKCIDVFKTTLRHINHVRVEYPTLENPVPDSSEEIQKTPVDEENLPEQ
jgi:putative nucleotidyltransferase with HDIG domain